MPADPANLLYTPIDDGKGPIVPEALDDLALTAKGWTWRENQRALAQQIVDAPTKIVMLEAECGSGKSIIPQAAAISAGESYFVLIQTINLQEQYTRDFPNLSIIKGRRNYTCNLTERPSDVAPCTIGAKCSLRGQWQMGTPIGDLPECRYFHAKATAARSQGVIHNYAYWLGESRSPVSAFARTGWIICDEAHEIDQILINAAACDLDYSDLRELNMPRPSVNDTADIDPLFEWYRVTQFEAVLKLQTQKIINRAEQLGLVKRENDASQGESQGSNHLARVSRVPDLDHLEDPNSPDAKDLVSGAVPRARTQQAITNTLPRAPLPNLDLTGGSTHNVGNGTPEETMKQFHAARRLEMFVAAVNDAKAGLLSEWVTIRGRDAVTIKPIYGKYGFKRILDAAVSKVILMSAFLGTDLLIKNLGLDPKDVTVIKAPKVFDRTNSKIYYTPVFPYKYNTTPARMKHMAYAIDRIAGYHATQKGLVHVPSVRLRDTIVSNSRNRLKYIAYDGDSVEVYQRQYPNKEEAIARFVRASTGTGTQQVILIGQSISTGLDLPNVPKWQVIPKLWFAPTDDPAIKKRMEVDKDFYTHHSICQIVQAAGRIKRTPDDGGPTFIIDEQFKWFWAQNRHLFPDWFRDNLVYDGWREFDGIRQGVVADKILCGIID